MCWDQLRPFDRIRKANMELSPGELIEGLVSIASAEIHGEMRHSKPPFCTILFDGVGTQVGVGVEVVWGTDEEIGGNTGEEDKFDIEEVGGHEEAEVDIGEDAREDTAVKADEGGVEREDAEE